MLRSGNSIRLTSKEVESISNLAGATPHVTTIDGLNNFINVQEKQYQDDMPEERMLKVLLNSHRIA